MCKNESTGNTFRSFCIQHRVINATDYIWPAKTKHWFKTFWLLRVVPCTITGLPSESAVYTLFLSLEFLQIVFVYWYSSQIVMQCKTLKISVPHKSCVRLRETSLYRWRYIKFTRVRLFGHFRPQIRIRGSGRGDSVVLRWETIVMGMVVVGWSGIGVEQIKVVRLAVKGTGWCGALFQLKQWCQVIGWSIEVWG